MKGVVPDAPGAGEIVEGPGGLGEVSPGCESGRWGRTWRSVRMSLTERWWMMRKRTSVGRAARTRASMAARREGGVAGAWRGRAGGYIRVREPRRQR